MEVSLLLQQMGKSKWNPQKFFLEGKKKIETKYLKFLQ